MNELGLALLLLSIAYLLGSVPTAYVVARSMKGIDIRQHGSGTVGGSNAWAQVGFRAFLLVMAVDVLKGALAVIVAFWLGRSQGWGALAGVAAVIGHNWPLWLGGVGGRGIATSVGVLAILGPGEAAFMAAIMILGYFLKQGATLALAGILALPILAWALGEPSPVLAATLALLGIVVVKRLLGNEPIRAMTPAERWQILRNRLLYDRDIADYRTWMRRGPSQLDQRR